MCNLIAIIPTTPSALYNTFGLDFAVPATPGEEPTMTTTTQTGTVDYRVAADYYGDFAHEYDTEAIDAEVLAQLNILTPEGVSVAANGMVFATIEAYAKQVGADAVIDSSNNPTLLYTNPEIERTQQVIDALKK